MKSLKLEMPNFTISSISASVSAPSSPCRLVTAMCSEKSTQALPLLFFNQISSASFSVLFWFCSAKSITVVVPPTAAACVPVV
jgi:hypothetical protein